MAKADPEHKRRRVLAKRLIDARANDVRVARGAIVDVLASGAKHVKRFGFIQENMIEAIKAQLDRGLERHREAIEHYHEARRAGDLVGVRSSDTISGMRVRR